MVRRQGESKTERWGGEREGGKMEGGKHAMAASSEDNDEEEEERGMEAR